MNRTIVTAVSHERMKAVGRSISRRRGFSLLEMVLWIAIGFGLITLGISAYGNASRRAKEAELTRRANIISAAIFANYSKRGDYRGITLDDVKKITMLPEEAFTDVTLPTVTPRRFVLRFAGIDAKTCYSFSLKPVQLGAYVQWASCLSGDSNALSIAYGNL